MFGIGSRVGGRMESLGEGSLESEICPEYRNYMQDFYRKLFIKQFKKN